MIGAPLETHGHDVDAVTQRPDLLDAVETGALPGRNQTPLRQSRRRSGNLR